MPPIFSRRDVICWAAIGLIVGLAVGGFGGVFVARSSFRAAPLAAAPAAAAAPPPAAGTQAPNTVTIDGHVITAEPGGGVRYTVEKTRTGGVLSESHERKSMGEGPGFHTDSADVKLEQSAGQPPRADLDPDGGGSASGGTASIKAIVSSGMGLLRILAVAAAAGAVWCFTRRPAAVLAGLACAVAAGSLWYVGDQQPWVQVLAVVGVALMFLVIVLWKAHLLGGAQGALDALTFAARKLGVYDKLHAEAHSVAEAAEKPFIDASRQREGA